ncbi:MAG TPA: single-stranded-DNA-specific exonuclease RecJ [Deltaproteobacteria bacterium]|nr:single-stranded-DNA-specific exonuclease RecJ [Deltaproteobacteria bacterium]HQB38995.1 single-stranded-DNA-specific exonuclease RecJ [Deltaproteobacteria bacterium]
MHRTWHLKSPSTTITAEAAAKLALHPVTARVLAARGLDDGQAAAFLDTSLASLADPWLMKGMGAAVDRILAARLGGERVCIYGDYDVDGITSTTLMVSFLRAAGLDCSYFIPDRFADGYGLNQRSLADITSQGFTLVIAVDCGITAMAEAEFCHSQGCDLIVVDHHTPGDRLPAAAAILNPLQPGCDYPFKSLAGVGVAFCLLIALRRKLRQAGAFEDGAGPDLREYLDLVALGTIADVVPLTGQNRILVHQGLKRLSDSGRIGVNALKQVAGVQGRVGCGQVGFRLAPRLNAGGRMESAAPGVELLLHTDPARAQAIAADLDAANAERQQTERRILDQAVAMLEASGRYPDCRTIVLASPDWHQGVVGIVASRLVEMYNRPTILLSVQPDGSVKGSGRSISGFHLLEALTCCRETLGRFGGHRHAAGVGLNMDTVDVFAARFEEVAAGLLSESDLIPRLQIDARVEPQEVTLALASDMKRLEPFGAGNPEPLLLMEHVQVVSRRVVGEGHLRLRLSAAGFTFDGIAFGMAGQQTDGPLDIAFFPELNQWNGSTALQLRIKAMRPVPCLSGC